MNMKFFACVSGKVIDGEPIMIAYRDWGHSADDSGWRFMSGSEDALYACNPDHSYTYTLNEVCEAYPEIKEILKTARGTWFVKKGSLFTRGEDGKFHLQSVDKTLANIPVQLFNKRKYTATPGAAWVITNDAREEKFILKNPFQENDKPKL